MPIGRLQGSRAVTRLKAWYMRNERLLLSGSLAVGFVLDVVTFRSLQIWTTFWLLGVYVVIASLGTLYVHVFDARGAVWQGAHWPRLRIAAPVLTQLALGALLSMSLQFYWFSGVFSVSWPIIGLLLVLIVVNEAFRHAYTRPVMQMAMLAFVLSSYFSQLFPYLFTSLEAWTFVAGGFTSFILSMSLVLLLQASVPRSHLPTGQMAMAICGVFLAMNALYFTGIIPPIPLSLREAGIYHDVRREGDAYVLTVETDTAFDAIWPWLVVHPTSTGRLYAFTAIYSPAQLDTTIFHRWERYDPSLREWVTKRRLSFPIRGGRPDGYRGYTYVAGIEPGEWRVDVETVRGQVLGRLRFTYAASE
jgi:hypothetical protein